MKKVVALFCILHYNLSNVMKNVVKNKVGKTRKILSFEPTGEIRAMLENELRSGSKLRQILERCVIQALAPKYPKLAARHQIIREERP